MQLHYVNSVSLCITHLKLWYVLDSRKDIAVFEGGDDFVSIGISVWIVRFFRLHIYLFMKPAFFILCANSVNHFPIVFYRIFRKYVCFLFMKMIVVLILNWFINWLNWFIWTLENVIRVVKAICNISDRIIWYSHQFEIVLSLVYFPTNIHDLYYSLSIISPWATLSWLQIFNCSLI